MTTLDASCPACPARAHQDCLTGDETVRRVHARRVLVALTITFVVMLCRSVPSRDDVVSVLADLLDTTTSEEPHQVGSQRELDWHLLWDRLIAAQVLTSWTTRMLGDPRLYFDLSELHDNAEQLRNDLANAYETACTAARLDGLTLYRGDDLPTVQRRVDVQRAANVDAELGDLNHEPNSTGPHWTVDYRDNGEFTATCATTPADEGPSWLHGYASTPIVAGHAVRNYFLDQLPAITFEPPLDPAQPRRLAKYDPDDRQVDFTPPCPIDLLTTHDPIYHQHLAACAAAQQALTGVDLGQALADSADELNGSDPQLPDDLGLRQAAMPRNRDHQGWVHGVQWVPASLVVASTRHTWGDFGDHRPTVPVDIARALVAAEDLTKFTYTLFADIMHLLRIPAWAGPLYVLGSNGAHRVHTARMLNLPWLAARVTAPAVPTASWGMLDIIGDDAGSATAGGPERRSRNRAALIAGLIRRNIIDGELTYPRSRHYPVLHSKYLPAPWLVRNAQFATRVNATYERKYPGALQRLGIPTEVGTDPTAWTEWLTP